jgi:hypothetical protein
VELQVRRLLLGRVPGHGGVHDLERVPWIAGAEASLEEIRERARGLVDAVAPRDGVAEHEDLEIRLRAVWGVPKAQLVGGERPARGGPQPPEEIRIGNNERLERRVPGRLGQEPEPELDRAEEQRHGQQHQRNPSRDGIRRRHG